MPISFDPEFDKFRSEQAREQTKNDVFWSLTSDWIKASVETKYSYGFNWLGVPIIQFPSDLLAFQEIVYKVKPTLVIECGVARGGSAIFWASMQHLCGIEPNVIGIDIDIRNHALAAVNSSHYADKIHLVQGSSIDLKTFNEVKKMVKPQDKVLVVLDSNHTHEHVLDELHLYSALVSKNSYLLVLDTVIEDLPIDETRPWGPGASPQTAVLEFMSSHPEFVNESEIEKRIAITVAPKGYWKKIT